MVGEQEVVDTNDAGLAIFFSLKRRREIVWSDFLDKWEPRIPKISLASEEVEPEIAMLQEIDEPNVVRMQSRGRLPLFCFNERGSVSDSCKPGGSEGITRDSSLYPMCDPF